MRRRTTGSANEGRRPGRGLVLAGILAVTVALYVVGSDVRQDLGIEFSVEGLETLRMRILGLGWQGPLVFVLLVTFRGFLLIPSHIPLILGGIVFGALAGTSWGALGLLLSALLQFGAARILGDDWVQPRLGADGRAIEERIRRFGPGPVWLLTAHPLGPQTPINLGAGLVAMDLWKFALAVALAAPLRAGVYAMLGTSAVRWNASTSIGLAVAFGIIALLPLASPTLRHRLWGAPAVRPDSKEPTE